MGITSYFPPIYISKTLLGKPKVHLLKKLSRKDLRKVWYAKHPSGYALERGRIDIALNKLTKSELARLIAYS